MNTIFRLHENYLLDVRLSPANAGQLITLEFSQAFPLAQHPRWQTMAQINAPPATLLDIAQLLQIGAGTIFKP